MAERGYRVRIVREAEEFEVEGDKKFVLDMLSQFEAGSIKPTEKSGNAKGQKNLPASVKVEGKARSVGEFVRQVGAKRHTDRVLVFGYYLEKFSGVGEFTAADLNTCYYDSKMESSNTSQMINNNIKRSFMMEAKSKDKKGKKKFMLTSSGEEFVENKLMSAEA